MNIAALLELLDIPFTGSSALVLGLSQDKGKTKSILAHGGIPTPAYCVWQPGMDRRLSGLRFPLIIKPLLEDASLGIDNDAYIPDEKTLKQQVQKVHQGYGQVLVEEYIEGRELNVSILGNKKRAGLAHFRDRLLQHAPRTTQDLQLCREVGRK